MPTAPELRVLDAGPLTTVQDRGRPGFGRYGVAEGGALDAGLMQRANAAVGNHRGEACLEFTLRSPRLRWDGVQPLRVGLGGDLTEIFTLGPGSELPAITLGALARGYIAVAGGIRVRSIMKSRATSLSGGFGGFSGRALRAGDRLRVGAAGGGDTWLASAIGQVVETAGSAADLGTGAVPVLPAGPSTVARRLRRGLCGREWRVLGSDRAALILAGPPLPAAPLDASIPLSAGVIQVTGAGVPMVLLRDHPTIGGYPLAGVVPAAWLDHLAQMRPGLALRFTPAELEE
ncbi:MAG: 5-oxoprolinase subunit C family protein [Candidatus Dormibacteria bacterium]